MQATLVAMSVEELYISSAVRLNAAAFCAGESIVLLDFLCARLCQRPRYRVCGEKPQILGGASLGNVEFSYRGSAPHQKSR
jgi:hypothetical protein